MHGPGALQGHPFLYSDDHGGKDVGLAVEVPVDGRACDAELVEADSTETALPERARRCCDDLFAT